MPPTARLTVLGLLGFAWRDVLGNLGGLARIAWPYYALAAACAALGLALAGPGLAGSLALALGPGTASVLTGIAVLACTVCWQRHVVLGEPLSGIAPLSGRVARYLLWSIVISLLCAAPILAGFALAYALGLVGPDPTGATAFAIGPAGIALTVAGFLLGVLLILRFILVLPAVSVDDRAMSFARSWRLTSGHGLKLLAALLLLTAGLALLGMIAALLQAALEAAGEGAVVAVVSGFVLQALVNLIASVAAGSLIARAYVVLAGKPA